MTSAIRIALFGVLAIIATAGPQSAVAQDCPGAKDGRKGFVVERSRTGSQTEVVHDGPVIRTALRLGGNVLLRTTQYQGLFELDRIVRGRRTTFKPKSNLAKLFPLKVGKLAIAEFEPSGSTRLTKTRVISLNVIGNDELSIGRCKNKVLKIMRRQSTSDAPLRLFNIDCYAPELKLVIAKEWQRGGRTNFVKFDRIFPAGR